MKRGIIRIIAGSVMILLQLISMIALSSSDYYSLNAGYNAGFNAGFYTTGIVGIVLLAFGISAYKKGLCSQLILHARSRKLHTVIKWVAFVITILLFVYYLITFITTFSDLNIYTFLMIFATLSFALYLLFYLYKKPCCLLSTSLIFIGIAYLYGLISNMTYYLLYLPEYDFYMIMVIFRIIPKLIAGILYIVLASKLYKENFSIKVIKVIGWIAFAMEFSNLILYPILVGSSYYFYNLADLFYVLFTIGLLLYISVFKINTLKKQPIDEAMDIVRFCRKCGSQLISDSEFCDQCGTEIIKE